MLPTYLHDVYNITTSITSKEYGTKSILGKAQTARYTPNA